MPKGWNRGKQLPSIVGNNCWPLTVSVANIVSQLYCLHCTKRVSSTLARKEERTERRKEERRLARETHNFASFVYITLFAIPRPHQSHNFVDCLFCLPLLSDSVYIEYFLLSLCSLFSSLSLTQLKQCYLSLSNIFELLPLST